MNFNQITSIHLYDLTHSLPLNPINKHYTLKFQQFNNEKCINLPSQMSNKFCSCCGQLAIPGLTTSIRIIYKKRRSLVYRCLVCNYKGVEDLPVHQRKEEPVKTEVFKATWKANSTNEISKDSSKAKQRIKKRKQNNLTNLLELKKKQKQEEAKKLSSLNLMEFMK